MSRGSFNNGTVLFRYERDMRESVLAWLRARGLLTVVELMIWHSADIVAGKYGARPNPHRRPPLLESLAIELKLSRISDVLAQAKINRGGVDWSYAAMPADVCNSMRQDTLNKFVFAGVGLLSVGKRTYEAIAPDRGRWGTAERVVENLWRRVRKQYNAGGVA